MATCTEATVRPKQSGSRIWWHPLPPEAVPGSAGDTLEQLLAWAEECGERVKHGPHRSVYRVSGREGTVYLKHYRATGWLRRVQQLFRATAARREFENTQQARRRGLPAVEVLAWGQSFAGTLPGDSVLLSREVPQARMLSEVLAELERVPAGQRYGRLSVLIDALARLCARMHDAGTSLAAFHPDNVLVTGPDNAPRLVLIDLPSLAFTSALTPRQAAGNLGVLLATLWEHRRPGRLRLFWARYLRHRQRWPQEAEPARVAASAREHAAVHRRRVAASRDKRALRNNKDFVWLHTRQGHFGFVRSLPPPKREQFQQLVLGQSGQEVPAGDWKDWHWVFLPPGRWPRIAGVPWRWHEAARRWRAQHALAARGIPSVEPLAVFVPVGRRAACLLYPAVPDALPWPEWAARNAAELNSQQRRRLARRLGFLLGRLHFWGYAGAEPLTRGQVLVQSRGQDIQLLLGPQVVLFRRRFLSRQVRRRELALAAGLLQEIASREESSQLEQVFRRAYEAEQT